MKKNFFILLFSFSFLFCDEVSVFGAGDLNKEKPYGLTSTEKHILKNKKKLGNIDTKVQSVKNIIALLNQRIDGLESIYESDSKKLNSTALKMNQMISSVENQKSQAILFQEEIANIKIVTNQLLNMQEEINIENKKNVENLKQAINKVTLLVNEINQKYISSKEFENNMKQFVTLKQFNANQTKTLNLKQVKKTTKPDSQFDKKSKNQLIVEARKFFKQDNFTKAIPILDYLIQNNYRPAESNYLLGEIHFYRKKYRQAITYFKQSALLYDKGKRMPKLLLHSAISFEKINDLENAKKFYNTIIDVYPDSNEAMEAVNKLSSFN